MFDKMIAGMDEFFLAVAIVTLLLGGIGVMNIMLVAVRERTREIGVRKPWAPRPRRSVAVLRRRAGPDGAERPHRVRAGMGLCALVNLAPMPERFTGMIVTWQTGLFAWWR